MKLASDVNSKQAGTTLLSGIKSSPDLAVFANGVMIRYLDFNDAYVSQMNGAGHPSDTVAALLTAAELRQRSGRDLITAAVLAYEVYCKIGDVFDYLGHGIDHTTVTGMGAVVGAGKLMGLSPEEIVHAIGITVGAILPRARVAPILSQTGRHMQPPTLVARRSFQCSSHRTG